MHVLPGVTPSRGSNAYAGMIFYTGVMMPPTGVRTGYFFSSFCTSGPEQAGQAAGSSAGKPKESCCLQRVHSSVTVRAMHQG